MKCNCGFESKYFSNHMGEGEFETSEEFEEQDQLEIQSYYDEDIFLLVRISPVLVHEKCRLGDYCFEKKELYMCPKCNTLMIRIEED